MASLYNSKNLTYNPPFNIILNPNGNSGEMFIVTPDETCTLDISFDYLFKFDCADLLAYLNTNPTNANILNLIESIGATLDLNIVNSGTLVTYTPVYKEQFFKPIGSGNTFNYITTLSGASSGLYLCGEVPNDTTCYPVTNSNLPLSNCSTALSAIFNILKSQSGISALTSNYDEIILSGLSSTWANYNAKITDQTVISAITNQNINISITVSGTSINTYVLLDNIEINRNCTHISKNDIFVSQSPGFELKKIIDNKKSWVLNTSPEERKYSVSNLNNLVSKRQTDYELDNGLQVLNTKEIDLNLDIAKAVETDVWNYILNNPLILTGTTVGTTTIEMGDCNPHVICVSDSCGDAPININGLMTQSLSAVTTVENFENYIESELVDAKNRKIISSYPTLRLLYDRYMNALNYSGKQSNQFDYIAMINFTKLIGNYWVDIIEQVMPSTAIWASSKVYGNHLFDSQKFKYRNSTLLLGTATTVNSVLSPCSGITCNADIITKVIVSGSSNVSQFLNQQSNDSFNSAYIVQFNSGSEFIGKVTSTANFVCNIELTMFVANNAYPNNTGGMLTTVLIGNVGKFTYELSASSSNMVIYSDGLVSNIPSFNNLSADTYTLTVTDSRGCSATAVETISLESCKLTLSSILNNNAYPNNTGGYVITTLNGANYPISYVLSSTTSSIISQGQNQTALPTFNNLSADTYSLNVIDEYNCSASTIFTVGKTNCNIDISATTVESSYLVGDGSITFTVKDYGAESVNGGPTNVIAYSAISGTSIIQSGTVSDNQSITVYGVSGGTYQINVQDVYGCTKTKSVIVPTQQCNLTVTIAPIDVYQAIGAIYDDYSSLIALVPSSPSNITYVWSNNVNSTIVTGQTISPLPGAIYTVTATTNTGAVCTATATFNVPRVVYYLLGNNQIPTINNGNYLTITVNEVGTKTTTLLNNTGPNKLLIPSVSPYNINNTSGTYSIAKLPYVVLKNNLDTISLSVSSTTAYNHTYVIAGEIGAYKVNHFGGVINKFDSKGGYYFGGNYQDVTSVNFSTPVVEPNTNAVLLVTLITI